MPKKRPPAEVWKRLRRIVWARDGKRCVRCKEPVKLTECHVDHVQSGKRGTNKLKNLRTLCRECHSLRACHRHQGMIASALIAGSIPPDWRGQVWG
jgi:5-methylcytosine-specific restriction protein A